jgi:hypothetical protein
MCPPLHFSLAVLFLRHVCNPIHLPGMPLKVCHVHIWAPFHFASKSRLKVVLQAQIQGPSFGKMFGGEVEPAIFCFYTSLGMSWYGREDSLLCFLITNTSEVAQESGPCVQEVIISHYCNHTRAHTPTEIELSPDLQPSRDSGYIKSGQK